MTSIASKSAMDLSDINAVTFAATDANTGTVVYSMSSFKTRRGASQSAPRSDSI
jgi:hypothetical protein